MFHFDSPPIVRVVDNHLCILGKVEGKWLAIGKDLETGRQYIQTRLKDGVYQIN